MQVVVPQPPPAQKLRHTAVDSRLRHLATPALRLPVATKMALRLEASEAVLRPRRHIRHLAGFRRRRRHTAPRRLVDLAWTMGRGTTKG